MLGLIEKFTASHMYPHEYDKKIEVYYHKGDREFKRERRVGLYNVKKKEYHFYDRVIFTIIAVFMIAFFYTVIGDMKGANGYITACVSLLGIFALLY